MNEHWARLASYIATGQAHIREANYTDFKPTTTAELELFEQEAERDAALGQEVLAKLSKEERFQLRAFAILRGEDEYRIDSYKMLTKHKPFIVGPIWLDYLDEFNKTKKVFT